MRLCIIIPAYNAERTIAALVIGCKKYCASVVVIDDGSRDWTSRAAEHAGAFVIKHSHNRGKGAALKTGFCYADNSGFDAVITLDADGQHDPDDIPAFLEQAHSSHFIIGSRMLAARAMPRIIRISNRLSSRLISWACTRRITDSQSGFRLIHRRLFTGTLPPHSRYEFESAHLISVTRAGFVINEVPIKTIYHTRRVRPSIVRDIFDFLRLIPLCIQIPHRAPKH
jgi:glycosyltransferase involved in cell wall biosynthesis